MKIKMSMPRYQFCNPHIKYVFFGGKGGVGKTVLAVAFALCAAESGKKTLLISTNPAHSLNSLFEQNFSGKPTRVTGVPNMFACAIDPREMLERSKKDIRKKVEWFLRAAEMKVNPGEYLDAATLNPALEEAALFENMLDLMFDNQYDLYVFDNAPAAYMRRILSLTSIYPAWISKLVQRREVALSLREELSSMHKKHDRDPLMAHLLRLRTRTIRARDLLTNHELSAFFFVTLPEASPVAVTERLIEWAQELGFPVGGVLVNRVLDVPGGLEDAPEFVRSRVAAQTQQLAEIERRFDGHVRAVLPLLESEPRGLEMLRHVAALIYAEQPGE